jgi:hypothetical protein
VSSDHRLTSHVEQKVYMTSDSDRESLIADGGNGGTGKKTPA